MVATRAPLPSVTSSLAEFLAWGRKTSTHQKGSAMAVENEARQQLPKGAEADN